MGNIAFCLPSTQRGFLSLRAATSILLALTKANDSFGGRTNAKNASKDVSATTHVRKRGRQNKASKTLKYVKDKTLSLSSKAKQSESLTQPAFILWELKP